MKSIEVIITKSGEVQIEASGFTGTACEQATEKLREALGQTTRDDKKPEYYAAHTQGIGGGL